MIEDNEFFHKKNRFVLYKNYIRSVDKMSNEQAGELFKMILHYVNTGELLESNDPRVDTAFDFIGERLEFDTRNYVETCRTNSENGKKGGRPKLGEPVSAEKDSKEKETKEKDTKKKTKSQKKPDGFSEKPKKPDTDTDTDTDTEMDTDSDTDTENKSSQNYYYCSGRSACESGEEASDEQNGFTRFGKEQYLTTTAEVEKVCKLADELMRTYRNKKATQDDYEKVFGYVHTLSFTDTGEHYGIYSEEKADLLCHAFEQASLRSDMNWQYIARIYLNYDKNNVTSVDEAIGYEKAWTRGELG